MRNVVEITVDASGKRDAGKVFVLTEWSAEAAENWGMRALSVVARSGADLPDSVQGAGMAGIAMMGLQKLTNVNSAESIALLNELMDCVQIKPDPVGQPGIIRKPMGDDIEEWSTRLLLKGEVFKLHTGFSFAEAVSTLTSAVKGMLLSSTSLTSPGP